MILLSININVKSEKSFPNCRQN